MKGVDECPACGSDRVFAFKPDGQVATSHCRRCYAAWEPFDPEDLILQDDPMSVFHQPCDNCAFRPGSVERGDPREWAELTAELREGRSVFFCHKGVPLSKDPDQSHDQPKRPDGSYDTDAMRECAGWMALRLAAMQANIKATA